ncbi:hypothetical protein Dsin_006770 [Dipteronia sinensis]|uniref:Uncharacterized protein n=1 Tax=Dipteronia sinensis TaxID=43782 RepID=A0AAE0AZW8_9ROSI|nr:hypothetical protein Dsin_006770 [Dipteronia sinensis]
MNVEYRKFCDVGISPDMMDMYDKMFKGSTSVGNCVMNPSSTILLEETVGDSEHDRLTIDMENDESSQGDQDRGKKRINDDSDIHNGVVGMSKGKKGKLGGAAKLSKQIDQLVEVVESRSTTTSMHRSLQGTSIVEVMEAVTTLLGAEKGSQLWWFATKLFCSQDKREMFSVITDLDLKLQFLILNQKKAEN